MPESLTLNMPAPAAKDAPKKCPASAAAGRGTGPPLPENRFVGPDGEELLSVTRACQGGPILSVTDPDGNDVRRAARRYILRQLPRYLRDR